MSEILRIIFRLTLSCLVAAVMMGAVFTVTDKAKKHNEHQNVQDTMLGLLGYGPSKPAPADLRMVSIHRYIIDEGDRKFLGYMVPVKDGEKEACSLVVIDASGNFVGRFALGLTPEAAAEPQERARALAGVLKPPKTFTFSDSALVARLGDRRRAYLLSGSFPGFKTFIQVILALDPSFAVIGLEIMEHEEDPGLGGEIEQKYFKNQFKGKSFAKVKDLKVVKQPLPDEYKRYLETEGDPKGLFSESDIKKIQSEYQDADIYALTGATISSRAVTLGVKNIARKFAYRLQMLDRVMADQHIQAAF